MAFEEVLAKIYYACAALPPKELASVELHLIEVACHGASLVLLRMLQDEDAYVAEVLPYLQVAEMKKGLRWDWHALVAA